MSRSFYSLLFSPPPPIYFIGFLSAAGLICITHLSWRLAIMCCVICPTLWTFQEYWAHRALMHGPLELIRKSHFGHHRYPADTRRLAIPMLFTLAFAAINLFFFASLFGRDFALMNLAGNTYCYVTFEICHAVCHGYHPRSIFSYDASPRADPSWASSLKAFHRIHHSKYDVAYGFTSPTWDYVFRTLPVKFAPSNTGETLTMLVPLPLAPFLVFAFKNKGGNGLEQDQTNRLGH